MRIDTNDMISVTEASAQGLSKLISEASKGRQLVVFKNNKRPPPSSTSRPSSGCNT
jgi:hypothetical protein